MRDAKSGALKEKAASKPSPLAPDRPNRSETGSSNSLKEAIKRAFQKRLREIASLQPPQGQMEHSVIKEAVELEPWAYPEHFTREARRSRANTMLKLCIEADLPLNLMRIFVKAMSGRPGAPVKPEIRRMAIEALEAKEADPKFSWQRFANAHCDCRKAHHDISCKERIRQTAMQLQRLLTRVHIKT